MPRATDYDICAFCPRLCRHVCPVAVGSGREAATPTSMMTGPWAFFHGHGDSSNAYALASLCLRCGACTAACKLSRPVDRLLLEARAELTPAPSLPPRPRIHGEASLVAAYTDERQYAAALADHIGEPVAWMEAPAQLGEALLDHPDIFTRHVERLAEVLEGRTLIVPSSGLLRVASAAGFLHRHLADLVPIPPGRVQMPACFAPDQGDPDPELLGCCGAAEPLSREHPEIASEVGLDQVRRLGGRPAWTPDARCGAWLRARGADVLDPVEWLLQGRAGRTSGL